MKTIKAFKISLYTLLIAGIGFSASAQKNIQEGSVRAPAGIKVDGKLTEWNDNFQATNKVTLLTYTLSNDDNNLYLAIKSTDQMNNNKITAGGISFTINTADKKKEQDAFGLVFPLISRDAMGAMFGRGQGGQGGGQGGGGRGGFGGGGQGGQRPQMDSATLAMRRTAAVAAAKEIKLIGFKDIPDSVISVYNDYGIKAALGYDAKGNLTYELSIPLKTLGLSTDNAKEFAYNLKVNGMQFNRGNRQDDGGGQGGGQGGGDRGGQGGGGGGQGGGGFGGGGGGQGGGGGGGQRGGGGFGGPPGGGGPGGGMQSMMAPTDFWGKYTLAKK